MKYKNFYSIILLAVLLFSLIAGCITMPTSESPLKVSANRGDKQAQYQLGKMYLEGLLSEPYVQPYFEGIKWLETAAKDGSPEQQYEIGMIILSRKYPTGGYYSSQKGIDWLVKAAAGGHVQAQLRLALSKNKGNYCDQYSDEIAFMCLSQSAKRGHAEAQYHLGKVYEQGYLVPANYEEAIKWYDLSAQQGFLPAMYDLGNIYSSGWRKMTSVDYTEAFGWYSKAAIRGYPAAQSSLGNMYKNGCGTPVDPIMAYAWLITAKSNGHDDYDSISRVEKELSGEQVKKAQSIAHELNIKYPKQTIKLVFPDIRCRRDLPGLEK